MKLSNFTTKTTAGKAGRRNEFSAADARFVDLLNDKNFKMVFTKEKNKQVLIDMLNCFIPDTHINDLSFLPQQQNPQKKELVSSAFDVYCETDSGRRIIVEVQYNERKDFLDRVLYYSTWPITAQVKEGQNSYTLNDVYIISFLNFALVHDSSWEEKAVSSYSLREDSNGEKMTDALHFIFIELGRFTKAEEEGLDSQEWWMYSLKNIGKMKSYPKKTLPQEIERLYTVTDIESMDENEKTIYLQNMRTEFDIRTEKIMAREEGIEEGMEIGKIEGKKEGIKEGLEKGKIEGKKEGMEKGTKEERQRIASTLKSMGMSSDDIIRATGLSADAVAAL